LIISVEGDKGKIKGVLRSLRTVRRPELAGMTTLFAVVSINCQLYSHFDKID
jgi:hypothetical protein